MKYLVVKAQTGNLTLYYSHWYSISYFNFQKLLPWIPYLQQKCIQYKKCSLRVDGSILDGSILDGSILDGVFLTSFFYVVPEFPCSSDAASSSPLVAWYSRVFSVNLIPYSGKFSRGRNFRDFRDQMPARENLFPRKFLPPKISCWRAEDAEHSVLEPQIQ